MGNVNLSLKLILIFNFITLKNYFHFRMLNIKISNLIAMFKLDQIKENEQPMVD